MQAGLEKASGDKWEWLAFFFSAAWRREAIHGLGVQDVVELILVDALSSTCWDKKKEV
jgi:hypothetical protein